MNKTKKFIPPTKFGYFIDWKLNGKTYFGKIEIVDNTINIYHVYDESGKLYLIPFDYVINFYRGEEVKNDIKRRI